MAQKYTYDREMIGALRTKVAVDILEVLKETAKAKKWGKFKKEMLLRLAPTVMPRVTEVSGPDGKPIPISNLFTDAVSNNNGDQENSGVEKKD